MNQLAKLENLRDNVRYWEWLFDISDKSNARQRLEGLKSARQHLKNHKAKYFPHLLQQPKFNLPKQEPFIPMSDWTERFEEYGDMY
jgi:hypothetical protein